LKNTYHRILSYIWYWLKKESIYAIQSPQLFKLYKELLLHVKGENEVIGKIEHVRKVFANSKEVITITDFGAGSHFFNSNTRRISDIVKHSTSSKSLCLLIQYFCQLTPARCVVELGTNLGITTQYLSKVSKGTIYTFEGDKNLIMLSKSHLKDPGIVLVEGNIKHSLPLIIEQIDLIDFALIDATHTEEATVTYYNLISNKIYEKGIIIISDIHWSKGMKKAWSKIKCDPRIRFSLDFYECGVLFYNPQLPKTDRILEF